MRFVYMDEAGTSAKEPITIVSGLIIEADSQLMDVEAAIREVNDGVPEAFRKNFVFHADAVWSDPKYRAQWSMSDRLAFLGQTMALPRRLCVPIAYGLVRRSSSSFSEGKLSSAKVHHVQAFSMCVARADKYIRERCGPKEIGSIVAEDVPDMRRFIKLAVNMFRDSPEVFPPGSVMPTLAEQKLGYITQETDFRVSRIRRNILFVEKNEDPLTQLADAIAFGLRRYHSELEFGMDFATAIFGRRIPPLADFRGPSSVCVYAGEMG
jgi:Protein of unknown function (DUF3800)